VLRLDIPRKVRARARAWSQFPIKSVELIMNGAVVSTITPRNGEREAAIEESVQVDSTGWLAVRCTSGNSSFPGGATLAAHSNPVFVELPGHPLDAQADAAYFLAWIDRLDADLKKRGRIPAGLEQVKAQLEAARAVYRRLAGLVSRR